MSITGIADASAAQAAKAGDSTTVAPQGQEFERLLRPETAGAESVAPQNPELNDGPGIDFDVIDRAQVDYQRYKELLNEIHTGGPFSPQELLALQAEVYQITLQLYTTTSAVSESVSDVKLIFQQQI